MNDDPCPFRRDGASTRTSAPGLLSCRNVGGYIATVVTGLILLASCDTSLTGTAQENEAPNTELSVQDSSLVGNIAEEDRLQSTVSASWSGTDPDGYVTAFELRYWTEDTSRPVPDEGWSRTTRNDSLILLPIPRGQENANVVFQVRAIDDDSTRDPTPAETVFPIRNTPPTLRLDGRVTPPDSTFTVASFAWEASDPEGAESLKRIEISLNDSTSFQSLPPDVNFITLVADPSTTDAETVEATVYAGEAFQNTGVRMTGLRLNAENTFYARAVDQTDTTSALVRYPQDDDATWYVRQPVSNVLFVNDYRTSAAPAVQDYHLKLLRDYLPPSRPVETWDLSRPPIGGSAGTAQRSEALPASAEPTLAQTLALFDYIYWVSSNSTSSVTRYNLPLAASVTDEFFNQDGKMMAFTRITDLPNDRSAGLDNPAVALLPMSGLITFPDSLRNVLWLYQEAKINPSEEVPGLGEPLPPLQTKEFTTGLLPYEVLNSSAVPLYKAEFTAVTRGGQPAGPWTGPSTVASISQDRRIGLFALELLNPSSNSEPLQGNDGNSEMPRQAIKLMLESLGFPRD